MRDVLLHQMHVPSQNIIFWANQDATLSRLENELPYEIKRLEEEDQFIFFYAGHGFHHGSNH